MSGCALGHSFTFSSGISAASGRAISRGLLRLLFADVAEDSALLQLRPGDDPDQNRPRELVDRQLPRFKSTSRTPLNAASVISSSAADSLISPPRCRHGWPGRRRPRSAGRVVPVPRQVLVRSLSRPLARWPSRPTGIANDPSADGWRNLSPIASVMTNAAIPWAVCPPAQFNGRSGHWGRDPDFVNPPPMPP